MSGGTKPRAGRWWSALFPFQRVSIAAHRGAERLVPATHLPTPPTNTNAHEAGSPSAATSGSARPLHDVGGVSHSNALPIPTCHDGRETSSSSQPPPEPLQPLSESQLLDLSRFRVV